mmetsp:Transcript_27758/g.31819  ORF Transcript_27758/g.31819 Transcript_27758/m.31819 type:complete len:128 (-) Transcript_27758:172-555(-)
MVLATVALLFPFEMEKVEMIPARCVANPFMAAPELSRCPTYMNSGLSHDIFGMVWSPDPEDVGLVCVDADPFTFEADPLPSVPFPDEGYVTTVLSIRKMLINREINHEPIIASKRNVSSHLLIMSDA